MHEFLGMWICEDGSLSLLGITFEEEDIFKGDCSLDSLNKWKAQDKSEEH